MSIKNSKLEFFLKVKITEVNWQKSNEMTIVIHKSRTNFQMSSYNELEKVNQQHSYQLTNVNREYGLRSGSGRSIDGEVEDEEGMPGEQLHRSLSGFPDSSDAGENG